jgi:chemotaxis methyl-accepting protein methylase
LLINVTNFFRDADAFQMLATSLIPKLFEARRTDDRLGAVFKANLDPVREKFAS